MAVSRGGGVSDGIDDDDDDDCADACVAVWRCRRRLAEDLRVEDVLNYLVEDDVVTRDDEEVIRHPVTSRARATRLVDVTLTRGVAGVRSLIRALHVDYPHLAQEVRATEVTCADRDAYIRWRMGSSITSAGYDDSKKDGECNIFVHKNHRHAQRKPGIR